MQPKDDDFAEHERLLWHVLASLARAGFVAPPAEARDIIHDFYADAWAELCQRFDPAKGAFATYLAGAFFRFARRKIVHLRQWRSRFTGLDEDVDDARSNLADVIARNERLQIVRMLIDKLPASERLVLLEYLRAPKSAQRSLARKRSLTRYQFTELLINALGRIAIQLGHVPGVSDRDYRAAISLWHDGRGPRATAALLGVPVREVHNARHRSVALLLKSLRSNDSTPSSRSKSMANRWLTLLKTTLLSENPDFLREVRDHRRDILRALETEEFVFTVEEEAALSDERVAIVYSTLGETGAPELSLAEEEVRKALFAIRENEETEIGAAFADALVGTLAEEYRNWESWFRDVPSVNDDYQSVLREDASVISGQPYSAGLIKYGITPVTIFEAAHGVELLLNRLSEMSTKPEQKDAVPERLVQFLKWLGTRRAEMSFDICVAETPDTSNPIVPRDLLLAEVHGTPNIVSQAVLPLTRWMIAIAQLRPLFFPGYQATPVSENVVRLIRDEGDSGTFARWSYTIDEPVVMKE